MAPRLLAALRDLTPANPGNIMKFEGDTACRKDVSLDPERRQLQGAVS